MTRHASCPYCDLPLSAGVPDMIDGQQESQNDGLHNDYYVGWTVDGMLWRVSATVFIPGTVRRNC